MNWHLLNSHNWCIKTIAKKQQKKTEQMRKWMRAWNWPQLQYADIWVFIQVYAIISLGWQLCNSQWYKFSSKVCGEHICVWIGLFESMLTPRNWLWDTDSSSSCIWQLKDSRWFLSKETSIKMLESIISNEDAVNYQKRQAINPVSIDMHQQILFQEGHT